MASPNRPRVLLTAVAASATLLVLVVLFVNASTGSRVAENAERLHWTNATLGTAALARVAAGQVATFQQLTEADVVPPEAVALAATELEDVTAALHELVSTARPGLSDGLSSYLDLLMARPVDMAAVDAAFGREAETLRQELDTIQTDINRSQSSFGRVGAVVRLAVTLVLPLAAIFFYRRRAAGQVREAQVRMEAQLEAERQVSRAKDQFIAGMSHEIRTPLTAIHGFSEVLMDSTPDAPADREMVSVINTESGELGRMVDDLIAASRLEGTGIDVELAPVALNDIAGQVVEQLRHRHLAIAIVGSAPLAQADPGRTRQILVNLVSNALHHGAEPIILALDGGEGMARCTVIDHGAGIPAEIEQRLYTRFVHHGTDVLLTGTLGLGTWVAREFARAMGGDVTHSRIEDETRFVLSLPAAETESAAPETADSVIGLIAADSA